ISQASPDVWVVVILYKDGYAECGVLMACLEELAAKYPVTKFVKIISTDCIPNYHDRNLPTLLVFNSGAVKANYVGMHNFGRRCIPEGVALVLCQSDHILNDGLGNQCLMKLERELTIQEIFSNSPGVCKGTNGVEGHDIRKVSPGEQGYVKNKEMGQTRNSYSEGILRVKASTSQAAPGNQE
ncbi:hypothetical protein AG4045_011041, partial [Apium graveolens]